VHQVISISSAANKGHRTAPASSLRP